MFIPELPVNKRKPDNTNALYSLIHYKYTMVRESKHL